MTIWVLVPILTSSWRLFWKDGDAVHQGRRYRRSNRGELRSPTPKLPSHFYLRLELCFWIVTALRYFISPFRSGRNKTLSLSYCAQSGGNQRRAAWAPKCYYSLNNYGPTDNNTGVNAHLWVAVVGFSISLFRGLQSLRLWHSE